jgi:glycosyltransferase involved in cell wall biosynthesis
MLKLLVFASLYPSVALPRHGIFTENRIRSLVASGEVDVRVVCPTPWFPALPGAGGRYSAYARVPERDLRHGIEVHYPRFPVIPKIATALTPLLLAHALERPLRELVAGGFDFDLLDAYYFYPDGVAAARLARRLGKPLMITAYGNDISFHPESPLERRMIVAAGRQAVRMTAVCEALRTAMIGLGMDGERIDVVLHGVDLQLFRQPTDRAALRARLGATRRTLLSVGHLIERKGNHVTVAALPAMPDAELWIVGDGAEEQPLRALAARLGVADQRQLPDYYGAADALVLASSREGIANVLMESMACGTPVLATRVWGSPEVITTSAAGVLVEERTPESLAAAYRTLFANYPERAATRRHAERFSWERTTADHLAAVRRALTASRTAPGSSAPSRPG